MLSVRRLFRSAPTARRAKRPATFRPVLELLEDRTVPAEVLTWTGGANSQDWFNPNNWDNWLAPTANDDVRIVDSQNPPNNEVHVNNNAAAKTVDVFAGGKLIVKSTLEVTDFVVNSINSTLWVEPGKTLRVTGNGGITNGGLFGLEGTADVTNSWVHNDWAMVTGANSTVLGSLDNDDTLWVGDAPDWPNYATGNLTVDRDFIQQDSNAITALNVNGATDYDRVFVIRDAFFAGHLSVVKTGNWDVRPNMKFKVFTYQTRQGTFAEAGWNLGGVPFVPDYRNNELWLVGQQQGAAAAVGVTSSQNPSTHGQSVTFTAWVSGTGGIPTGEVVFLADGEEIGSAMLNAQGQATFTTSALAVGSHAITALYLGDETFAWEESDVLTQSVVKGNTITSLSSSNPMPHVNQPITFTATVTDSPDYGFTPTGTVEFWDYTNPNSPVLLGTATLNGSGQAQFTTSFASFGSHTVKAKYLGDDNFFGSEFSLSFMVWM